MPSAVTALTPTIVLTAFVVFCRIGGCLLVIPGFSSPRVLMRARLFVAIAVALALTPMLQAQVQPQVETAQPIALLGLMLSESLKGVLIGLLGRFFFLALETMAISIANAIGLVSPLGTPMSYAVLPVTTSFDPRVGLVQLTDDASRTFLFTLRIAAPFLVFSIVANFAIGLINKLVPQVPVTFVATPFLIAGGMVILYFAARPALDLFIAGFAGWLRFG